jgi:hypothetical protein
VADAEIRPDVVGELAQARLVLGDAVERHWLWDGATSTERALALRLAGSVRTNLLGDMDHTRFVMFHDELARRLRGLTEAYDLLFYRWPVGMSLTDVMKVMPNAQARAVAGTLLSVGFEEFADWLEVDDP